MFLILPVASETPLEETPRVTYGLVGVLFSVWLFLTILWVGENFGYFPPVGTQDAWVRQLAYIRGENHPWTFLTSSLVHTNPIHLLFNLMFIWLFGCYVEERLGWRRYLLLLAVGAVAGDLAYSWGLWFYREPSGAMYPFIGASGIVTTLFGAQLILLPYLEFRFLFVWLIYWMYQPAIDSITLPAMACIPIWLSLKMFAAYWIGDLSMASYTASLGGFLWGITAGATVRLLPTTRIFERSHQRLVDMRQQRETRLDYRNFQSALKGDAPKAAFDIYKRARNSENPLPVTIGEMMDLANQLMVLRVDLAAGAVYRDVLRSKPDENVSFEASLRLARISLHRLGDIQEAKDLLRNLHERYKEHRRYYEVLDLIEQVKEIEGRSFQGTG